jgi:hypothetical protein
MDTASRTREHECALMREWVSTHFMAMSNVDHPFPGPDPRLGCFHSVSFNLQLREPMPGDVRKRMEPGFASADPAR